MCHLLSRIFHCEWLFFNNCDWCIFDPRCFILLSYASPFVVFLDHGHQCFQNFYSTIPVDVIRVKSSVNHLSL